MQAGLARVTLRAVLIRLDSMAARWKRKAKSGIKRTKSGR